MGTNIHDGQGIAGDTLHKDFSTKGDNRAVISPWESTVFIYGLSEEVSERMIEVIQDFFTAYPLGKTFNDYLGDSQKSVIVVDEFNNDTQQLPQIVVNSLPIDTVPLHFGNREGQTEYQDRVYFIYSGDVNVNTTITLYDSSKKSLSKLMDVVLLAFMQYIPGGMGRSNINVMRNPRFTNPTKVTGQNLGGEIFMSRMTVECRSTWRQFLMAESQMNLANIVTEPTATN